jgi:hypothetical protein
LPSKAEADLERLRQEHTALHAEREQVNREFDRKIAENEARQHDLETFIKLSAIYNDRAPKPPVQQPKDRPALVLPQPAPIASVPDQPRLMPIQSPPALTRFPPRHRRTSQVRAPHGAMLRNVQLCADLIRESGRPWHTRELIAELTRRGFVIGGANQIGNLSNRLGASGLLRSTKTGWHLIDWPDRPNPDEERVASLRDQIRREMEANRRALPPPETLSEAKKRTFYGVSVPDAAIAVLAERKEPLGNVELASVLQEAGYPFEGDLVGAIESGLRRRQRSRSDMALAAPVVRVAPGTWGLASWFSDEDIARFAEKIGRAPAGRDWAAHKTRTQEAVRAAKARGVRFGLPSRFTEEQMATARQMAESGASTKEIAAAYDVTPAAVVKWKKKWRAGGQD